jgi:hypothetical protein
MQSKQKLCLSVLGVVVLLLQFFDTYHFSLISQFDGGCLLSPPPLFLISLLV